MDIKKQYRRPIWPVYAHICTSILPICGIYKHICSIYTAYRFHICAYILHIGFIYAHISSYRFFPCGLDDGGEVDLDLGNYECFLDIRLTKDNNLTTEKIYQSVINKERRGDYLGKTVQGEKKVSF